MLSNQTESKGNFCFMRPYTHIALFQPQAIRAKKTNLFKRTLIQMALYGHLEACCHFAPPKQPQGIRAKTQTFTNEGMQLGG
jgi:hypothetical protein